MAGSPVFNYDIQPVLVLSFYPDGYLRHACGKSKLDHRVCLDPLVGFVDCSAVTVRLKTLVCDMPITVFRRLAAAAGLDRCAARKNSRAS